jgi:hypothetical protein
MPDQRTGKCRPSLFGYFYWSRNEKLVVRMHEATFNMPPGFAKLRCDRN